VAVRRLTVLVMLTCQVEVLIAIYQSCFENVVLLVVGAGLND